MATTTSTPYPTVGGNGSTQSNIINMSQDTAQNTITAAEVMATYGDDLRISSPVFKKDKLVADVDPIFAKDLVIKVNDSGSEYGYATFNREDFTKVNLREPGKLSPDTKLGVYLCFAQRETPEEYGGYEIGTPSLGLWKI